MAATEVWSGDYLWRQLEAALLNPIRAFRPRYLPLLMVYFAYGALGLIAVAESFWVKKALTLTPGAACRARRLDDAAVDREDGVRRAGRQRADPRLAAALLCVHRCGFHRRRHAAARRRGGRLAHLRQPREPLSPRRLRDRARRRDPGRRRRRHEHRGGRSRESRRHAAHQGRGRSRARHGAGAGAPRLSLGIFVVAGLAGWIASIYTYETVFLVGPRSFRSISVSGALLDHAEAGGAAADRLAHSRRRHRLRRLRAGACLGRRAVQPGDRVRRVDGGRLRHAVARRRRARCRARSERSSMRRVIIFVYRAMPLAGQGYTWFTIDVLGFDEAFQGMLAQIGAGLALARHVAVLRRHHAPSGGAGAAVADGDYDACCRCRRSA